MKIWFAANIQPSSSGGVSRSMNELAARLKQRGHRVRIIYATTTSRGSYVGFALKLMSDLLLSIFSRPDWIIARSSDGVFCAACARLFRLHTKIILHNHGWEEKVWQVERRLPASAITNPTTWKARFLRFWLLRLALRWSHACLCGTVEEARWIARRYPYSRNKLLIVPNGVDIPGKPFWSDPHADLPPSFLMVGGFTWKKHLEYGIEIFMRIRKEITDARLFLVGTGEIPSDKEELLAGLGDSVFTVTRELPEKMIRWYETCPYLLSTSRYEGGRSFALLEAQACGCVVFSTSIPSSKEVIVDNLNGILLSGCDRETDVRRALDAVGDRETMRACAQASSRIAHRHRWHRQVDRLERWLQSKANK